MKRLLLAVLALAGAALVGLGYPSGPGHAAPALPRPAPGHFAGKFELVPLFDKGKPVIRNGHSYYAARNDVQFTTAAGDTVTFHAGQRTDLASIPQAVWWLMPPDGPWAEAALPHDACYRTRGDFSWYGHPGRTRATPYVRAECDEILRQGMVALGVPAWKRVTIYEAVRIGGGGKGWGS
ncbi:MAG: DUF1353 domain-containing protein [Pseudomonadota bacterium]